MSAGAQKGVDLNVLVLSPTPTHPQDFGNRKRIFRVCKRFAEAGAQITFVHYPAESEWRRKVPASAERAMQECWDHYYTIAPTRPLHTDPEGLQHGIDEWWDEAIGGFLNWIFTVQRVDIFIVNYSWLSKALDFAPPGTFKVLDTHDKVSGRRDMLASLRLGPEFFYTNESEESVALRRADLVWAIKEQERAQFEEMSQTPVVTMQHLDALTPVGRPQPDADGYLRVGVIGARNNVNRMNIMEFLDTALPLFEAAFAPVKIVIAGTVCDLLEDIDSPFVELRGQVADAEEFYRTVDCVAVPMRASTGLKIKTGEALSLGMPLLSLAHAFEGYEQADTAHGFADFTALAKGLIDLSFAPRERLDALAKASATSHAKTSAKIEDALAETIARSRASAHSIVLTVDSKAFVQGSVLNAVLESVCEYLREIGALKVLVVRGSVDDVLGNERCADLLDRLFIADDIDGAQDQQAALSKLGGKVVNVREFLTSTQPKILVVDALHPDLAKLRLRQSIVLSRPEVIAFSDNRAVTWIPGGRSRGALAAMPRNSRSIAALAGSVGAATLALPCFRLTSFAKIKTAQRASGRKTVAILGDPSSPAVNMAVEMARAWAVEPFVVFGFDTNVRENTAHGAGCAAIRADAYLDSLFASHAARPHFALDISRGHSGLGLCCEVLERLRVPLVYASERGTHPSLSGGALPWHVGTERELWRVVRSFALDSDESRRAEFLPAWAEIENGKGWAWFSRLCEESFGPEGRLAA
ncbi:MAG TPA: glycosyltransferase [Rhizomicrobium sp.]|nr:glycosyltransferase [Rhizomicrobium sp.]